MTTRNLTDTFVAALAELAEKPLSASVRHQVKRCILDYLGVTLAGARTQGRKSRALLRSLGRGDVAMVFGLGERTGLHTAALVNGIHAHVAELDDGVRFGSIHPGAPIFSALLPLAERERWTPDRLFLGIVVGYEAAVRLAAAIQPGHRHRGFHATGTCGTLGVAMGIAAAIGATHAQMHNSFAAAVLSSAGMLKAMEDDSELKPFNAGQAAGAGLVAAMMGQAGFQGPRDVLGGPRGFLALMADEQAPGQLIGSIGTVPLAVEQVYVKPYAACRHCHAPIEAALGLRDAHNLLPDEIERVRVRTYRLAVGGHDHTRIEGVSSAKMSTPYSVAVALQTGKAGLEQFSAESIRDAAVLRLTQRIDVELDPSLDALVPGQRPAILDIRTISDKVYRLRVDLPKGEPETALSDTELQEKFTELALFSGRSTQWIEHVSHQVWHLETHLDALWQSLGA